MWEGAGGNKIRLDPNIELLYIKYIIIKTNQIWLNKIKENRRTTWKITKIPAKVKNKWQYLRHGEKRMSSLYYNQCLRMI